MINENINNKIWPCNFYSRKIVRDQRITVFRGSWLKLTTEQFISDRWKVCWMLSKILKLLTL